MTAGTCAICGDALIGLALASALLASFTLRHRAVLSLLAGR